MRGGTLTSRVFIFGSISFFKMNKILQPHLKPCLSRFPFLCLCLHRKPLSWSPYTSFPFICICNTFIAQIKIEVFHSGPKYLSLNNWHQNCWIPAVLQAEHCFQLWSTTYPWCSQRLDNANTYSAPLPLCGITLRSHSGSKTPCRMVWNLSYNQIITWLLSWPNSALLCSL